VVVVSTDAVGSPPVPPFPLSLRALLAVERWRGKRGGESLAPVVVAARRDAVVPFEGSSPPEQLRDKIIALQTGSHPGAGRRNPRAGIGGTGELCAIGMLAARRRTSPIPCAPVAPLLGADLARRDGKHRSNWNCIALRFAIAACKQLGKNPP
jgi:hypothetical protein